MKKLISINEEKMSIRSKVGQFKECSILEFYIIDYNKVVEKKIYLETRKFLSIDI